MNSRIFFIHLGAALEQLHCLIVTPEPNEQTAEIVSRRVIVRLQLQRATQQALALRRVAALDGKETKVRVSAGVIRIKLDRLLEFPLGQIKLSLSARRIAYQIV